MINFASDFHLGMPEGERSFQRELKICAWLDNGNPLLGMILIENS